MRSISGQQQPPSKTRFHHVKTRACARLRQLNELYVEVTIECITKTRAREHLATQSLRVDAPREPTSLHEGPQWRLVDAQQQPSAHHPLVADESDFESGVIGARRGQQRNE